MTWFAKSLTLSLAALTLGWTQDDVADRIRREGMANPGAYSLLRELTKGVGNRLSGSDRAAKAVTWGAQRMRELGFANVHLVPCKVPHWVRGKAESASMRFNDRSERLSILALGGSVGTPSQGIEAEVIEVKSLSEAAALGERAKGKIVFYNRGFDPTLLNTFAAYGGAVDQRVQGASVAAKVGAVAVLVRSMTTANDDEPHTGALQYVSDINQIPAAALSLRAADRLSIALREHADLRVRLKLNCQTLPEVDSASVVGEITGSSNPEEIILMGGHLDSWDVGEGAHDDGAGIAQSMEALAVIQRLGLKPKRTIRVVLFMNEENGGAGGDSYAEAESKVKHIAAIESDSGGFAPRGFGVTSAPEQLSRIQSWLPSLQTVGIERIDAGGGGSDISPLGAKGAILIGLRPESQRYFDFHHSRKDTLEQVNPRELELGAVAMSILAWKLADPALFP